MDELLLWVLRRFPGELSLMSVKIEGILWSVIDVFLVLAVLRIADLARAGQGRRRIRMRYVLLAVSAVLTPFLLTVQAHLWFWLLECAIIGLHLAILVASTIMDGRVVMVMLSTVRSTLLESSPISRAKPAQTQ